MAMHDCSQGFSLSSPQHKTRGLVSTSKGTQHLSGELQSASDLDFYIDGVSLTVATL